ncbi:MAG: VOC family protein [Tepidiformaceae bacterium]
MVKPIPDGYPMVRPSLIVSSAEGLISFIGDVFGGTERMRMPMPDGTIAHAEVQVGDSVIMTADATEQWPARQAALHVYSEDVDAAYQRALAAGATTEMEPEDQIYGERSAVVLDPWGNRWAIATHVEDVSDEEMMRRMEAMGG